MKLPSAFLFGITVSCAAPNMQVQPVSKYNSRYNVFAPEASQEQTTKTLEVKLDESADYPAESSSGQEKFYNSSVPLGEIIDKYRTEEDFDSKPRKVVVYKNDRRLQLYLDDVLLKEYPVALSSYSVSDKLKEGDMQTPEGEFYLTVKFVGDFYKSLLISYPTIKHAKLGLEEGLINLQQYQYIADTQESCQKPPQKTALGGEILIHGGGSDRDWTLGCVALENKDMDEIFAFSKVGCEVVKDGEGKYTLTPKTIVVINH